MISTVDEGFHYLESFTNFERSPGGTRPWRLERMAELVRRAGNPHREFRAIHIAGSKGKGSTATLLSLLLEAAGNPTGLYLSPHLENYRERITRAGGFLPEEFYLEGLRWIEGVVRELEGEGRRDEALPTTFELLTLLAFRLFAPFPWAVLETGLGGRLDATNVVSPEATIITPIELEHTEYLGETIGEIAGEKAGILKAGAPLFTAPLHPEAAEVIGHRARQLGIEHYRYEEIVTAEEVSVTRQGTEVSARLFGRAVDFRLPLLGGRQARNALLALGVTHALFPDISFSRATEALEEARIPGRMELLPGEPPILLDGAHTPESVGTLAETLSGLFPEPWTLLFGSLQGKRHREMAARLAPHVGRVWVTRPGTFRKSDLLELAAPFEEARIPTDIVEDPAEAFAAARGATEKDGCLVVTGSFYLAGIVRTLLEKERRDVT